MKYFLLLLFNFLSAVILLAQPQNDDCSQAIDLGIAPNCETTVYSNINATASNIGEQNIPECFNGGSIENDVWFTFTIPNDGNSKNFKITLTASEDDGILNPQLAIYRGDCLEDQLSELGVCASAEMGTNSIEVEAIGLKTNTKYFLRINDFSATATPNWGNFTLCIEELAPFFIMGESNGTGLCTGTLFDSGGREGDYSSNEDTSFTVCPTSFFRCLEIVVEDYDTETEYDFLKIYEGENTNRQLLSTINGLGFTTLAYTSNDCFTVQFTSDASQNRSGFRLSWQCLVEECPQFEETTCANPAIINQIPFQATDLTTCFAGNNLEIGACGEDEFISGQEYILAYDSPGGECISVNISGAIPETGISILRGCPESGEAVCINQKQGDSDQSTILLPNVSLKEKGTYYFIIAHEINCTPFNIEITNSSTCPNVFPSAADCEKGLILNGCNPDFPTALTVEPGAGDPDFFQFGVNNGCWDDVFETNYTWFTFEAQGDGEFAFLLSNNDPDDVVDIDFNIWGPFDNLDEACFGSDNSQPIRSSWADDLIYSVTGLANTNPELGTPITTTCEGAFGEGFVAPLKVKKGEVYVVLINDFDGVIFSGAIDIDFSGSDPNVLKSIPGNFINSRDTFICAGDSFELFAEGASAYEWSPSESLSCRNCPNPIATPKETTTYTLNASTVCSTISEEITLEVIKADAGPDQTVCQGATINFNADTNAEQVNYQWTSPNGIANLSCTDCPNPTLITTESGTFEYIIEIGRAACITRDTMILTVIEGTAPSYEIAKNQQVCLGEELNLGSENVEGQVYEWTSNNDNFSSNESNPSVSPSANTTYFLNITTDGCSISTMDSVQIEVNQLPILNIQKDTIICEGSSINLGNTTIENGVTYQWETDDLNSIDNPENVNAIATPNTTITYTLTAQNGACSISESVRIEVIPIAATFQNQEDSIQLCLGESLELNVIVSPTNTPAQITTLDGTLDTNSLELFFNPAVNQIFITNVETNGCHASDTLVVKVDSLPKNMDILPADTTVCIGTQLVLESSIYDPQFYPNIQHQWIPNVGFDSPDSFYNLVITPTDSIDLQRINQNGACIDTSLATINVLPFIEVPIDANSSKICDGESTELLPDLPEGTENIAWTPTENISCTDCPNPAVSPFQTTTYSLSGTFMDCPLMGAKIIEVENLSGTSIVNFGDSELFIGQKVDSIILVTNLDNIESIEWRENGNLIEGANGTILNYTPLANAPISKENQTVLIEAQITTLEGCTFLTALSILVKPPTIPNAFTPGNDGMNDFFNILLPETANNVVVFKIFNRWGKVVYDNNDPERGWNGRLNNNGDPMPAGVYVYNIQYKIEEKIEAVQGDLTLIR